MPRLPRPEIPGIPLHVTQRGVNRCAIFLDDDDRHHYRRVLRETTRRHAVTSATGSEANVASACADSTTSASWGAPVERAT